MRILKNTLAAFLLCSTAAMAEPASESSIKQLLAVTQAKKLVDGMRNEFDSLSSNAVEQELQGKAPTPSEQQAIEKMRTDIVSLIQAEFTWEIMEPMYIRLYKESFSEEEIVGMLAFYNTPAGQAVIHKMPALMQRSMLEAQKIISVITPKIKKIQEQFYEDMASAR